MRVFVGSMMHESNTFANLRTRLDDFIFVRNWKVKDLDFWMRESSIGGIIDVLGQHGAEIIPGTCARALPSGIVDDATYVQIRDAMINDLIEAMPVDGVCLALHGAMYAESTSDPEGDLLTQVRTIVGPNVPIVAALDMHANVTEAMAKGANALCAYRTAPHTDKYETGERAARLLLAQLTSGRPFYTHLVRLPLLASGEQAETRAQPMISILALARELEQRQGVESIDVFIGYAWADSQHTAVTVVAVGDAENPERAGAAAEELACYIWGCRDRFIFSSPALTLDELPAVLMATSGKPIIISDAGDNPTAGASQNLTLLLKTFLDNGIKCALFAIIVDAEAVESCARAGLENTVELSLGSLSVGPTVRPLPWIATVKLVNSERGIAVVAAKDITVVIAKARMAVVDPCFLEQLGLDVKKYNYVVLKSGYISPAFQKLASSSVLALTPGETDPRLTELPFRNLLRPMHPLDKQVVWKPKSQQTACKRSG